MSEITPFNAAPRLAASPPADPPPDAGDEVRITEAGGLRGALGLVEVTVGGVTRTMSREDAQDLKRALKPLADTAVTAPAGREVLGDPGPVYDVAKTSQATIDALKKSRDDVQRRLGHTIENARASYGDLLAQGGRIVVTTSAGNGGQPVMTVTGPGFDPDQPARVHTHYHGDNATVADPVGAKAGTNSRIREAIARNPQTVFVLPEAKNAPGGVDSPENRNRNDYHANWSNVQSQVRTTEDALTAAGVDTVRKEIVSVHSRGGEVIQRLMAVDKHGGGLRADRLELYDSLYGSQNAVARWGQTANGKAAARVIYYRGTNEAGRHAVIENTFRGRFTKVEMKDQKPLDDTTHPVYHGAQGETYRRTVVWFDKAGVKHVEHPLVRQFHDNPHYRTTGQFLDAYD